MNNRAIIFIRNGVGSQQAQKEEQARLEQCAAERGFELMAYYMASGDPNMLTIDMLIEHTIAWAQPGHILVADLSRLWIGDGVDEIIDLLASAGAIVHVVP